MGTPLTDSCSDGRCFLRTLPQLSMGIIREVTKLGDFLLQRLGSECRQAAVVSTQWKHTKHPHKVNGQPPIVEKLYDLHAPRAEAGKKNSINIMNEGAAVIMSLFPQLTSTCVHILTDL